MDSVNLNLYHMHTIGHSSKGNQLKGRFCDIKSENIIIFLNN